MKIGYSRIVFTIISIGVWQTVISQKSFRTSARVDPDSSYGLNLEAPIVKWDEAIPLGNGLIGGLLWGEGNEIRLSLDRGDLWDLRPHPGFNAPGFTYDTVIKLANAGRTDTLNARYSRANPFPTKLPGCRLVLTLPENTKAESFQLNMLKGLGSVNLGESKIESFFSPIMEVALVRVEGELKNFELLANKTITKLGNPAAKIGRNKNATWLIQDAKLGFQYVFYVQSRKVEDGILIAIAVTTNEDSEDPLSLAIRTTTEALNSGYNKLLSEHEDWWNEFWSKSSINIPDPSIQQHYNLVQYFYGAASRKGAPPIPLQGVWTADAGTLPPWRGDYHNDLNTQLTYWAYLTSNRFEQGESFLDFMWSLKPTHEKFAKDFYDVSGHIVPGVMALDGSPMGAWYQFSLSPTMGAWVAQSFYWHWRYTMDMKFLKERGYPYSKGIAEALVELMKTDENGKLKLPLSTSPEIHNNSQKAWVTPNSNFDLSLIRWIFEANIEMAKSLELEEDVKTWNSLLTKMDNLAVAKNNGALLISPGEALDHSHRHFSNLMAIYPLNILNIEGTNREREIINASLKQIDSLGTKAWNGYTYSWMACMRARLGQSEQALESLKSYMDFTSRNGFHLNGPQSKKELSDSKMRAFTLEGNFAAAQAVHEMLLQSWGNKIRVFPAVPEEWADVSFEQLRAEGGYLIDADRQKSKTLRVSITSTKDNVLLLKNPFGDQKFISNIELKKNERGELTCFLKKGQTLLMTVK